MVDQQSQRQLVEQAVRTPVAEIDPDEISEQLRSDAATDRALALQTVFRVASAESTQPISVSESVAKLLEDDVLAVRVSAALAAMGIARTRPNEIVPAVPALIDLLADDPPLLRFRAASALAPLTESHPEVFPEHTGRLVAALSEAPTFDADLERIAQSDELTQDQTQRQLSVLQNRTDEIERSKVRSEGTREVIINILVEVARINPDSCEQYHSDIVTALSDDNTAVRAGAVEVVRHMAAARSDPTEEISEVLIERLTDDAKQVRARAVRALGSLEIAMAVDPLFDLSERETNDELAALAAETAEWLASNTASTES